MKNMLVATAGAILVSHPADAYESRTIAGWSLSGQSGACVASWVKDGVLFSLVSADGNNDGGIAIGSASFDPVTPGRRQIELSLGGSFRTYDSEAIPEFHGYYVAYGTHGAMKALPDSFRIRLKRDGVLLADMQVEAFKTALIELLNCDAQV